MTSGQLNQVLRELEKAGQLHDGSGLADTVLLEHFISRRDEEAFAGLVRRHGPMVLGVCRRMLRNPDDAEDAFQATFLVLVRKAGSIRRRHLLGNWLYGTAYRAALEARAARRRLREWQVDNMPEREVFDEAEVWRELRPVLDDELNRLPDKYRLAVVLCDLEGGSRTEVATRLAIPEGTLSSRLNTARRRLARRLTLRGVSLGGGVFATTLSAGVGLAAVPAPLVAATVKTVSLWAAGEPAAGAISAKIGAITLGVLKTMFMKKLKIAAVLVLLLTGLGTGAALLTQQAWGQPEPFTPVVVAKGENNKPDPAPPEKKGEGKAREAVVPHQLVFAAYVGELSQIFTVPGEGKDARALTKDADISCIDPAWSADGSKIVFMRGSKRKAKGGFFSGICVMDADGRNLKQLTREGNFDFRPTFSPDGKKVMFSTNTATGGTVIRIIDVDGENLQELGKERRGPRGGYRDPAWSPDGTCIAACRLSDFSICLMDPDGGNVGQLTQIGGGMHPVWSPDGQKIAFLSSDGNGQELFVMNADGSKVKKLSPREGGQHRASDPAWSPDSKKLAYSDNGPVDVEIFVVNADGTNHKQLTNLGGLNLQAGWSPNGKKVSFLHLVSGKSVPNSTTVYVMDPDGRNQKEVFGCPQYLLGRLAWRPAPPAARGTSKEPVKDRELPGRFPAGAGSARGRLPVAPGKAANLPVAYSGAFRIRAMPIVSDAEVKKDQVRLTLEVAAEPSQTVGRITIRVTGAVDDRGQELKQLVGDNSHSGNQAGQNWQQIAVTLKLPADGGRIAKTLRGTLANRAIGMSEVKATDVLKSAGKTFKGGAGTEITIHAVEILKNGDVVLDVLTPASDGSLPGWSTIHPGGVRLDLIDAAGKPCRCIGTSMGACNIPGSKAAHIRRVTYQPEPGAVPRTLVFGLPRLTTSEVPFVLRDVPLQ
jgi:RNA polymerase sigma factor (sigma-70 family)